MIKIIYFKEGTQAEYDNLTVKDKDTLYFISDTQMIYKGDILYTISKEDLIEEIIAAIPNAEGVNF